MAAADRAEVVNHDDVMRDMDALINSKVKGRL